MNFLKSEQNSDFKKSFKKTTVLFLGHGSRVKSSNLELEKLVQQFKEEYEGLRVGFCYVELAKPSFNTQIIEEIRRDECEKLIILPVFLFASLHVKNDIPLLISKVQRDFPHKEIICADAMKASSYLVDLARKRIECTLQSSEKDNRALLVVGRGSSDPDSNGEFEKIVRLIYERGGFEYSLSAAIGITKPLVEDQLRLVSRLRPKSLIVFPYFLFHGRLLDKLNEQLDKFKKNYPWISIEVCSHLGTDKILVDYFKEHFERILRGDDKNTLPCNTCHYRPEIGDISNKVKGVKALLWSVRHLYTHSQAKPHEYPHASLRKHVLVCENIDCANRGSKQFSRQLRKLIKADGHMEVMKVTKTSCMGRCGEGPSIAVYPDGVWYRNVTVENINEIYHDHLLNDRIVEGCVDDIMV